MENSASKNILQKHSLKLTGTRLDVLDLFEQAPNSLTYNEIAQQLGSGYDKVTIYRTLSTFEEAGIIHKIMNANGSQSYALCQSNCTDHHHADNHVHFECIKCHNLVCLTDVHVPPISLPNGYKAQKTHFLLEGICASCS